MPANIAKLLVAILGLILIAALYILAITSALQDIESGNWITRAIRVGGVHRGTHAGPAANPALVAALCFFWLLLSAYPVIVICESAAALWTNLNTRQSGVKTAR